MTREEVRKLMGGYATGSLTEAERKVLFEAALEDQDLFDELAREQALKEMIETPGVRGRLLAALGPPQQQKKEAWWMRPLPWAGIAGAAAVILVALIVTLPGPRPEEPVEVASVRSEPAPQPVKEAVQVPAVKQPPRETPKAKARNFEPPAAALERSQPAPVTAPLAVPPPLQIEPAKPEPPKLLAQAREEDARKAELADSVTPLRAEARQDAVTQAQSPPPPPADSKPVVTGAPATAVNQFGFSQGAAVAKGKGGKGGAAEAVSPFGFSYTVSDGSIRIVPTARAILTVSAGGDVLFPANPVLANTPIVLPIPQSASEIRVVFSARQGLPDAAVDRRDEATGTVTGPPDSQLRVTIPAR